MQQSSDTRIPLDEQVAAWTCEAKKHILSGNEAAAFELYKRAADLVPGAPWLQQRVAALAKRLGEVEVALVYCRKAATAFSLAGLRRRALGPLRTAWQLVLDKLPAQPDQLVELTMELTELQSQLGLPADSLSTMERANRALRTLGHAELMAATPRRAESEAPKALATTDAAPIGADVTKS